MVILQTKCIDMNVKHMSQLSGNCILGLRRSSSALVRTNMNRVLGCNCRSLGTSTSENKPRRKKSMKVIQEQHLAAMKDYEKKMTGNLKAKEEELEHERTALRGSDGFLEFKEVDPPWTLRGKGSGYNVQFFLDDANYILRKSKKADQVVGGISVLFVVGVGAGSYFNMFY